ncbi:MAG: hypothetical protein WC325_12365 [Candidatus Bathyarchaeia archaeon]|jgi:hypothetical protein
MKILVNFLIFAMALQIVCYLFWVFNVFGGLIKYPLGDTSQLSNIFSISAFDAVVGIGGAVGIGLAMLLLKQGTYAIYAMLLWAIGVIFKVIQTFILVIPNTIGALLPNAANPLPPDPTTGVYPTNPLVVVVVLIFTFGAWWYMFGLVIQRDVT